MIQEYSVEELTDFAIVADRGRDVPKEIHAEIFWIVMTEHGSLAYYREYGVRYKKLDQQPVREFLASQGQKEISEAVQTYSDGAESHALAERRAVASSRSIEVDRADKAGAMNIRFRYTALRDIQNQKSFSQTR